MQPLRTGKPCGTKHDAIFIPVHFRFSVYVMDGRMERLVIPIHGSQTLKLGLQ
jgi:hypothetical protein